MPGAARKGCTTIYSCSGIKRDECYTRWQSRLEGRRKFRPRVFEFCLQSYVGSLVGTCGDVAYLPRRSADCHPNRYTQAFNVVSEVVFGIWLLGCHG